MTTLIRNELKFKVKSENEIIAERYIFEKFNRDEALKIKEDYKTTKQGLTEFIENFEEKKKEKYATIRKDLCERYIKHFKDVIEKETDKFINDNPGKVKEDIDVFRDNVTENLKNTKEFNDKIDEQFEKMKDNIKKGLDDELLYSKEKLKEMNEEEKAFKKLARQLKTVF